MLHDYSNSSMCVIYEVKRKNGTVRKTERNGQTVNGIGNVFLVSTVVQCA